MLHHGNDPLGAGRGRVARADGHTVEELRQQLRMITEGLQELEAKQAGTEEMVDDTRDRVVLSTGKSPGSFLIPGTNTEFSISGYVKADFIYDLKQKDGSVIYPAGLNMNPGDVIEVEVNGIGILRNTVEDEVL